MEIAELIIPAIAGLLSGILGVFFAPWVKWGFEKKKLVREERKKFLSQCREVLSNDISSKEFRLHPVYSKLKPYLSSDAINAVEGSNNSSDVEEISIIMGNGRYSGVNPFRQKLLDEIAHQERVWELI